MADQADFQALATPNPQEMAFRVRADATLIFPTEIPALYTAYKACSPRLGNARKSQQALGDYIYTHFESDGKNLWFYFAKDKTKAEAETPFRRYTKFDQYGWDSIMFSLQRVQDTSQPISNYGIVGGQKALITGKRWAIRPEHIEGGEYGTLFTVEEFTSPRPFDIPRFRTPVAKTVAWNYAGDRGVFRKCLHADLTIEDAQTTSEALAGTTYSQIPGVLTGQKFPATNMARWQRHVVHCDQQLVNGVWHMQRVWANPPPLTEPSITTD